MADAEEGEQKQEKKEATRKVNLHRVEIPEDMKDDAILYADTAMDKHSIEKDVATDVKKFFDQKYGGTWHCVVGANYGTSITHQTKYLMFFQLDQAHILLFCSDKPKKSSTAGGSGGDAKPPADKA
mmetsp:Transcript_7618/g.25065  ORF Transcript_7618/g.25065 Transcript_7618/m.25065 type:complete len:126 (+) Transcript_7618:62-439(+)|eukprot:CAMPEP_0118900558 /NCGR_PEP_ID=MMETSP1166-20130328/6625_1 /TAXON_ID=1104430 /ORGANISM="Chrysoreinhardia sp, Strain CCMP3193" /LENGTH=125 /DNA_ID=CAMNT_0006839705 /DNA_START=44 /DNA_END=421 /DNA_ORIENTATION=+